MSKLTIEPEKMAEIEKAFPSGKAVTMINLVTFNEEAKYENSDYPPCTGQEAYYVRYVGAFYEVAKELGVTDIEVVSKGKVAAVILGPSEPKWDDFSLVKYKGFAAMRQFLEHPEYLKRAEPHRLAALKDWEWIATYDPEA